jgi:hypothetical protein
MVGDPDTSIPADQPEQDVSTAQVNQRVVNTQGGDYAGGDIDKRQGKFVEGDQFNFDGHFPGATVYAKSTIYQAPRESPPAFQVPYQPVPLIGRDEVLAELADLLTGDALVAIIGMAGVGKTVLAAAFAHQRQAAFPGGIFWLNMEQPDLIAGQVAACASPGGLDLLDFPALSFDERIARVRAAWNSPLRRLIVLDNLEDPDLLGRWQPTGSGARVLITTRCDDWPRYVRRLRLPVLLRSDSIELLLGARAADLGVPCETLTGDAAERDAAAAICDPGWMDRRWPCRTHGRRSDPPGVCGRHRCAELLVTPGADRSFRTCWRSARCPNQQRVARTLGVCLALAALIAGGLVPYGAPVIAWLLSVSRVRLLIQPIGRRFSQLLRRTAARLQSDTED